MWTDNGLESLIGFGLVALGMIFGSLVLAAWSAGRAWSASRGWVMGHLDAMADGGVFDVVFLAVGGCPARLRAA